MKLKCYFAHPYSSKDSEGEKRIIEILKDRRIEVINPFDGENEHIKKHYRLDSYFPTTPYNVGRWIWTKCLNQLHLSNMAVFWIPEDPRLPPIGNFMTTARGCYAELQEAVNIQRRRNRQDMPYLIQLITKDRHPIIAWALCSPNQLYEDIDSFERFKQMRWK